MVSRQLLLPLLPLLCLPLSMLVAAADAPAARRPGCRTRCGGVDIPYPFRIDRRCAIHGGIQLNYTSVDGSRRPFSGPHEVTKISVPDGKAWMKMPTSTQCYDPNTGQMMSNGVGVDFTSSPFWFSDQDNKFIVIGCHTLAYMLGVSYVIGCLSICDQNLKNGSCSGAGCCQADVPENVRHFNAYFNETYTTTQRWRHSRCSYMVVMEQAAFNYSTTYIASTVFNDTYQGQVPVVMDWEISQLTCDIAKSNMTPYACVSSNSDCVNSTNERGYRCKCSDGYQGNPYIVNECKDIDECQDSNTYPCAGICKNTLGGFTCLCPQGKHMVNGVCIPDQKSYFWVMPVLGAGAGAGSVFLLIIIACAYFIRER